MSFKKYKQTTHSPLNRGLFCALICGMWKKCKIIENKSCFGDLPLLSSLCRRQSRLKSDLKNIMKTETQKETSRHFTQAINKAGLAELHAIDKRLDRHYNAGTLAQSDYGRLTVKVMEELARFDCIA